MKNPSPSPNLHRTEATAATNKLTTCTFSVSFVTWESFRNKDRGNGPSCLVCRHFVQCVWGSCKLGNLAKSCAHSLLRVPVSHSVLSDSRPPPRGEEEWSSWVPCGLGKTGKEVQFPRSILQRGPRPTDRDKTLLRIASSLPLRTEYLTWQGGVEGSQSA